MSVSLAITLLTIILEETCFGVRYDNYTLLRGVPTNKHQLQFFENLSTYDTVNFWTAPGSIHFPVEFSAGPKDKELIVSQAMYNDIYLTVVMNNVQSLFDTQAIKNYTRRNIESFDWRNYFSLDDIYKWLRDIAIKYKEQTELIIIGKTFRHRNILALKVNLRRAKVRSTIIIEAGIHAREWISPAVATYLIYAILQSPHSDNVALQSMASTYEWYFVPVLNPDGYEYSFKKDRMWRKNRNCYGGGCGVDLNRNFAFAFATSGVSLDPADETFCGPHAFSEPETKAMADFVKSKSTKLEYYIALHAYGQYMIIPYCNSKTHLENYEEVQNKCLSASRAIRAKFGTSYQVGTAYDTVGYLSSGVSPSWVKYALRVPSVVTFELRDNGSFGFALPSNVILPTSEETLDAILEFIKPIVPKTKNITPSKLINMHCQLVANNYIVILTIFITFV